ncbi:MAG: cytidylate kinase family protein [Candidatus Micrarchaeota archaeon]|nr:cytidylate kinase family protein [Candidatus Micrarchaeota archaeon]MDE1834122.1 cytidylate kinase family protein [Candidatus Micrarchaeota archaeon]MDE1859037.1 cytidylate kinase family protein [Candidatus Micrarchaeota archaeon]
MIIAISGLTGSGKSTIGEKIAQKLKIKHVSMTHKKFVPAGTDLLKFTKGAKPSFEKSFDSEIIREARKEDCVVTTWLGPWLLKDATVKVWLHASLDTRIKRKIKELGGKPLRHVKKYVIEKDDTNRKRYKRIYKIDLDNRRVFDIDINTDRLTINQAADLIIALARIKSIKK